MSKVGNNDGEVVNVTAFSQQLAFLSRGALDAEATDALAKLVRKVRETGKAGSLTLTIKVSKLDGRDEDALKLTPKITLKTPELAPFESVMFSTHDGDLLRVDPRQRVLDLKEVPGKVGGPLVDAGRPAAQQ